MKKIKSFTLYEMIITLIISGIVINLSLVMISIFSNLYSKKTFHHLDRIYLESSFIHDSNRASKILVNHDTTVIRMVSPLQVNQYQIHNKGYVTKNKRDTFFLKNPFLKSRLLFIVQNKINQNGFSSQ